ncbi:MAG: serpin family protein [Bacillota bacterium]|nr:serpin family protein [Bacillota bacterium]
MRRTICLGLAMAMLLSMVTISITAENNTKQISLTEATDGAEKSFTYKIGDSDISIPFAQKEADTLNKLGLFKGTEKGYELEKPVTRAEAITMILRMVGEEKDASLSSGSRNFSDVLPSHWAYTNIGYAAYKGYINGTSDKTFTPDRGVTGQEFVKMLLSAIGYQGITIAKAYEAGIKYELLTNNYTKLAVSTEGYSLIRSDVVGICYSSLLVKNSDGKFLKDILAQKGIVDKEQLESLISSESDGETESFAWNLNKLMPTDKNYMFSPLSIKMALAMAAVGADGDTQNEILKVLQIQNLDEFNELSAKLIKEYSENDKVKLNIANSLWLNADYCKDVDFESSFKDTIQKYYGADSSKVNNANAVESVNKWVKNKTNGKITQLISDSNFLAYIVNAVYFKGEWAEQFAPEATRKAEFTDRNGKRTEIDFMNMTGNFYYYEDSSVQMLKLPYKDGKTSMYIAIPQGRTIDLDKYIEKMESKRVKLSLPKFKTEYSTKLIDTLSQMGIHTAFDADKADFKKMFTEISENVFISDVIHKTYINVDENGTEAAAVTGIGFATSCMQVDPPIVFNADKPFTYFIRDDENGEILFMGEYAYAE